MVAAGVVLRFLTHSALWLDEALTVDRARLPVSQIAGSVKQDGAPPLYYYLLHFWMRAVRPVRPGHPLALGGDRRGSRSPWPGWPATASGAGRWPGRRSSSWPARPSPSTTPPRPACTASSSCSPACGFLALHRALQAPRPGNLIAVAVVTAALLYTQYWSLYLVGVVGLWLLVTGLLVAAPRTATTPDGGSAR